jgi:hypothetical protein
MNSAISLSAGPYILFLSLSFIHQLEAQGLGYSGKNSAQRHRSKEIRIKMKMMFRRLSFAKVGEK